MVNTNCTVLNCLSTSRSNKDLKFHQFPHDTNRRTLWLEACNRTDIINNNWDYFKHKYVCSLHFQESMYSAKGRLKKFAFPSINISKPSQRDYSTQTLDHTKYMGSNMSFRKNEVNGTSAKQRDDSMVATTSFQAKYTMSCYTQTEECLPDDLVHTKSEHYDTEIKNATENLENVHTFNDKFMSYAIHNIEVKKEIEEEFITQTNYVSDSQDVNLETEIKKEAEIDIGSENGLEKRMDCLRQEKSVKCNSTNVIKILPIKKVDAVIQTDDVIIFTKKSLGSVESGQSDSKKMKYSDNEKDIENITLPQFLRSCAKFLPPELCTLIKNNILQQDD